MIKAFHHADMIIPKGMDHKARDFYCDLLGFKEIEKPDSLKSNGGFWLQIGSFQLHLSYERKEGVDPTKTKAHLAFETENLQELKSKLIQSGYSVKEQTPIPGMERFESVDPFGHRLEFLMMNH